MLRIINSAHPDQYQEVRRPFTHPKPGAQPCSRKHEHTAAIDHLESKLYKLDESQLNESEMKRARSSYGTRQQHRTLAN